jgi:hypothetical protein
VAVLVVVGAAVLAISVALLKPFASRDPVPATMIPAANATVTDVADTYMRAVDSQHCEISRALTLPTTRAWCTDPELISYRRDGEPVAIAGPPGGPNQTCVPYVIETTESADRSLDAGVRPWSLCFTRTAQGWRLSDQGFV